MPNGGGGVAVMNGDGQYLQHLDLRDGSAAGRVYGDGMPNGDRRRDTFQNGNAVDDPSAAGYELREGSRGGQLPPPSSYPPVPPPPGQTAFSLSTGPQEHLMMVPMNHVGGAQFVLKPPKIPKARGRVRGRPRGDAGVGERTLEIMVVDKVDSRDVGREVREASVEETVTETTTTTTTTAVTSVNGGEEVVRNDERDLSEAPLSASEDDDDDAESVDSSLHTHYALHPSASAQNSEAHARSSLLPSSASLQADPGGSETNTFAAPPRPSRKIKRYPCDVCGHIFTRSGDVRRHKESRHSEGSSGCRCPFCGRVLTRCVLLIFLIFIISGILHTRLTCFFLDKTPCNGTGINTAVNDRSDTSSGRLSRLGARDPVGWVRWWVG